MVAEAQPPELRFFRASRPLMALLRHRNVIPCRPAYEGSVDNFLKRQQLVVLLHRVNPLPPLDAPRASGPICYVR